MKNGVTLIKFHSAAHAESVPKERASADTPFLLRVQAPQPNQTLIPGMPISVTGLALTVEPMKEIVVTLGKATAFAKFGLFRSDLAAAFPGNHAIANSGFSGMLQAVQEDGAGRIALTVTARTRGGKENSVEVPLTFESAPEPTAELVNGPLPPGGELIPFKVAVASREDAAPGANQTGSDVMLCIDEPVLVDGVATQQVKGGLSVMGWTLAKEGIKAVSVELDGILAGHAHYGMRRPDLAGAFPYHAGALLSGFGFSLAQRALTEGRHFVSVKALSNNLKERKVEFAIDVAGGEQEEGPWSLRRRLGLAERRLAERLIAQLRDKAEFVVWLHCARAEMESIRATLRSLSHQIYPNWSVVLVGAPAVAEAELIAGQFAMIAARLHRFAEDTPGSGVPGASGDNVWVMPVAAGDVLSVDALMEFALLGNQEPSCDLLYADERRLNPASHRVEAFFKPQWSADLLWSTNYIGRPWCTRLQVLERAQRSAREFMVFGHYDLVLHCAAQARRVMHIPQVLCERRPDAVEPRKTEIQALRRAAKRGHLKVAVEPGRIDGTYRVSRKEAPKGLVSIIIPTCAARGLIKTCIESLRRLTTYPDVEIICVDNVLDEASQWKSWLRANADVVVEILDAFNWSQFNNIAAREASGAFLLFLNDDIEIIQPDWLQPLLDLAVRPEVGIVGPQLLYPDRRVQHAGMFLAGPSTARHAFRYCEENDPGYHGLALTQRNVIALTGACMLVRAEVFGQLGGFDEAHAVINNDVDFCLKAHDAGLRNVYTPFSQLIHHELGSRAQIKDEHDLSAFTTRWDSLIASGDPFFHRHLSRSSDSYQHEAEPVRAVFAGHPLYQTADIKCILAVKVDHIGDFVTAFPALQRIKEIFPQSRLCVLASPASQQLAALEPAIDQVIPFEFFHARSDLGQKEVGETELATLATQLASLDIDIAIDLRKHPDTRPLLQQAGAKWTAGFDWCNQFPWLDIALTWEGDTKSTAKRSHIAVDLVNLVDAVGTAGRRDRDLIQRCNTWSARQYAIISQLGSKGLYDRPVVCIHPASGNETKEWPPQYFARLADGLIKADDVNIVLVGGPDDAEIVTRMLEHMTEKDRVTSLVGRLRLDQLAYFLDTCALFVGNDSGPKHIAAALGVPTVGIHSGVVDPREFGPLGDAAVVVKRDMTCAPCYSAKREDCHRGLACLTGLSAADVLPLCRRLLGAGRSIRPQA